MAAGECFYCGKELATKYHVTKDHLIAKMYVKHLGHMPAWWHESNSVVSCADCNGYKGHLKAMDWLVIMPRHGARNVAERLELLGMDRDAVARAMARRPEAFACT